MRAKVGSSRRYLCKDCDYPPFASPSTAKVAVLSTYATWSTSILNMKPDSGEGRAIQDQDSLLYFGPLQVNYKAVGAPPAITVTRGRLTITGPSLMAAKTESDIDYEVRGENSNQTCQCTWDPFLCLCDIIPLQAVIAHLQKPIFLENAVHGQYIPGLILREREEHPDLPPRENLVDHLWQTSFTMYFMIKQTAPYTSDIVLSGEPETGSVMVLLLQRTGQTASSSICPLPTPVDRAAARTMPRTNNPQTPTFSLDRQWSVCPGDTRCGSQSEEYLYPPASGLKARHVWIFSATPMLNQMLDLGGYLALLYNSDWDEQARKAITASGGDPEGNTPNDS
ncbi:hypothetical protein BJX61DRAFT_538795 [Aspergillus egyptiacus]|nr:hypothetical protein BJX61DRAFT_538795 [Aspergillus egyptiacus]